MLKSTKPNLSQTNPPHPIKRDDKLFTKLVSKETSIANPSFRLLYYGGVSGAVPFIWETQPGTPKHRSYFSDDHYIPPTLTPPPSFYFTQSTRENPSKKHSRSKLLNILLLRINHFKKNQLTSSPSSSSSSSSSLSYSSSKSEPARQSRFVSPRKRLLSIGSSFDDDYKVSPRTKTGASSNPMLCFGIQFRP